MIRREHKKEAKNIGDNSFELINFCQLPKSATPRQQIEALHDDQRWQEDHNTEISKRIDYLINDISVDSDD